MRFICRIIVALVIFCMSDTVFAASGSAKDWLEIPAEYKDEVADKLEQSKEFTAEQMEMIKECLEESSFKETLNCISKGGVDEAAVILSSIAEAFGDIKERICGSSSMMDKNRCSQFKTRLQDWKDELSGTFSGTIKRGQQYLEERNKLFHMKRKICNKIGEKGCWTWLDERIDLKCNPEKIGTDLQKLEDCRLEVVNDVWERLNR